MARKFVAEDPVSPAFQETRRGRLGRAAEHEMRRRAHVPGGHAIGLANAGQGAMRPPHDLRPVELAAHAALGIHGEPSGNAGQRPGLPLRRRGSSWIRR